MDSLSVHNAAGSCRLKFKITEGSEVSPNEAFVIDQATRDRLVKEDPRSAELLKPFAVGDEVRRYHVRYEDKWLIFTRRGTDLAQYPAIEKHLLNFRQRLEPKPSDYTGKDWPGRKPGSYKWHEIQDGVDYYAEFEKPKIVYPEISKNSRFSLDRQGLYFNNKAFLITPADSFLLALMNSKAVLFFFSHISSSLRGGFYQWYADMVVRVPVPSGNQVDPGLSDNISALAEKRLSLEAELQSLQVSFARFLRDSSGGTALSSKLKQWYELDSQAFLSELGKRKPVPPVTIRQELSELFNVRLSAVMALSEQAAALDADIDKLVYALYGLTAAEIAIVENSVKAAV